MFTIGQVAKKFSLSRSSLLYYDAKGVLSPSGRSESNYRLYSDEDIKKLQRIVLFRNAGMPLSTISEIINQNTDKIETALENRLYSINKEIQTLRKQQAVIINIINNQGYIKKTRIITKEKWVAMLKAAGLDEKGMWNWHFEFEKSSPEAHQDFLESIGIPIAEIALIRKKSKHRAK